jgi:hypothetical protein
MYHLFTNQNTNQEATFPRGDFSGHRSCYGGKEAGGAIGQQAGGREKKKSPSCHLSCEHGLVPRGEGVRVMDIAH